MVPADGKSHAVLLVLRSSKSVTPHDGTLQQPIQQSNGIFNGSTNGHYVCAMDYKKIHWRMSKRLEILYMNRKRKNSIHIEV